LVYKFFSKKLFISNILDYKKKYSAVLGQRQDFQIKIGLRVFLPLHPVNRKEKIIRHLFRMLSSKICNNANDERI
jgi:hypothetical protein